MNVSPRKLIAEFVKPGIVGGAIVTAKRTMKLGAAAAMFCLTVFAGASMVPSAQAATIEKMTPAECVFHFVADGGLYDTTRIKDENGKILYVAGSFESATNVVTDTLGSPGAPLFKQVQKWDFIRMQQIDIEVRYADLPRDSAEYRRLRAEHKSLQPALDAARAEIDKTVKPLAERVLAECDATLKAMPTTVAEKDLDQTKLDDWFLRHSRTPKEEVVRVGRALNQMDWSFLENIGVRGNGPMFFDKPFFSDSETEAPAPQARKPL